ncbi:MAG: family 10 glycosylhydrolase [Lachnospiraceae bacterium]|nr:family 10 glycosylhydrolase [Lachnospiraceae bacterium]
MNRTLIKITSVMCAALLFMLMPMSAAAASAEAGAAAAETADAGLAAETAADTSGMTETGTPEEVTAAAPAEFRAVWFSFRDWQTYLKGKSEKDFRSTFQTVCQNCKDNGLNAIIVHVRSHNDAAYPSSCYPWSDEMCGGNPGYDPLAMITEIAHANGLQVHAWINPYGYRNGKYCGDKSLATRDNILAGVREILDNYNVEGIHFDDYFPPLGASVHNSLLKDVYNTVHSYGKVFGVSPSGNIDNNRRAGVDVDTWLANTGYIDYICPQIYWSNAYGKAGNVTMYSDRLAAWKGLNKAGIRMYIGLAAYRCGEVSGSDPGWSTRNTNLSGQVKELRDNGLAGYILFSYSSIVGSKCSAEMSNLRALNR